MQELFRYLYIKFIWFLSILIICFPVKNCKHLIYDVYPTAPLEGKAITTGMMTLLLLGCLYFVIQFEYSLVDKLCYMEVSIVQMVHRYVAIRQEKNLYYSKVHSHN